MFCLRDIAMVHYLNIEIQDNKDNDPDTGNNLLKLVHFNYVKVVITNFFLAKS